ncbi:2842_t:CDS:2 [Diversispora eburnea]|uniref:2842_t:CDS:1 n=1 Tax=Diversispora eburnea TaxID=1213867 RepID=A0A9N9FHQ2_9GLOM|nr:2842_t:CDS:2 [Diversispora eburnea]
MQSSIIVRIIFFFIFVLGIQAYNTTLEGYFDSICHVYVTDCNRTVINDAGNKSCDDETVFIWDQAPELYCVHVYPITEPDDNRYRQANGNSCFYVHGNLLDGWSIDDC